MSKTTDGPELVRRCFAAYQHKDRAEIEAILAGNFHFTSPRDDHIDRREYFERCQQFNEQVEFFQIERLFRGQFKKPSEEVVYFLGELLTLGTSQAHEQRKTKDGSADH